MDESRDLEPTDDGPADEPTLSPRERFPWADDYLWMQCEREKPNQGVLGLYEGLWVVVFNKQVVGAVGTSEGSKPLNQRVAEHYGVDTSRLLQVRVSSPDDPLFTR